MCLCFVKLASMFLMHCCSVYSCGWISTSTTRLSVAYCTRRSPDDGNRQCYETNLHKLDKKSSIEKEICISEKYPSLFPGKLVKVLGKVVLLQPNFAITWKRARHMGLSVLHSSSYLCILVIQLLTLPKFIKSKQTCLSPALSSSPGGAASVTTFSSFSRSTWQEDKSQESRPAREERKRGRIRNQRGKMWPTYCKRGTEWSRGEEIWWCHRLRLYVFRHHEKSVFFT